MKVKIIRQPNNTVWYYYLVEDYPDMIYEVDDCVDNYKLRDNDLFIQKDHCEIIDEQKQRS